MATPVDVKNFGRASVSDEQDQVLEEERHLHHLTRCKELLGHLIPHKRPSALKVIGFVDMDCYYVAVERRLNQALLGVPVAVVQYNPFENKDSRANCESIPATPPEARIMSGIGDARGNKAQPNNGSLIAVSYEAREAGVTRSMRGKEALKKCPSLQLVQVPTAHGKADLTIYRDASQEVVDVLSEFVGEGRVEKASVDEFYMDLTSQAWDKLASCSTNMIAHSRTSRTRRTSQQSSRQGTADHDVIGVVRSLQALVEEAAEMTHVTAQDASDHADIAVSKQQVRDGHSLQRKGTSDAATAGDDDTPGLLSPGTTRWWERPLLPPDGAQTQWTTNELMHAAAVCITARIRAHVQQELGSTCSGGVANSKILAKLCGGLHKPDQQTVCPPTACTDLLRDLPIERLRGLGGHLGETVKVKLRVDTVGNLANFSVQQLEKVFDSKTAQNLWKLAQGIDLEGIADRDKPKSVGAGKTFWSRFWGGSGGGVHTSRAKDTEKSKRLEAALKENPPKNKKRAMVASDTSQPEDEGKKLVAADKQGARWVLRTMPEVERWMSQLSQEVAERLTADHLKHKREATQIRVSVGSTAGPSCSRQSTLNLKRTPTTPITPKSTTRMPYHGSRITASVNFNFNYVPKTGPVARNSLKS